MNQPPELAESFIKMVGALCLVLLIIALLYFVARRYLHAGFTPAGKGSFKVLASLYLGGKKQISLVQVPGRVLVVGICPDGICLLDKIEDEKLLNRFLETDVKKPSQRFSGHLAAMLQKGKQPDGEKAESHPSPPR